MRDGGREEGVRDGGREEVSSISAGKDPSMLLQLSHACRWKGYELCFRESFG